MNCMRRYWPMRVEASSRASVAMCMLRPMRRSRRSCRSLRSSRIRITNSRTMPAVATGSPTLDTTSSTCWMGLAAGSWISTFWARAGLGLPVSGRAISVSTVLKTLKAPSNTLGPLK
ncbi:hypothetical protein D3C71_1383200 [compost metagenome]